MCSCSKLVSDSPSGSQRLVYTTPRADVLTSTQALCENGCRSKQDDKTRLPPFMIHKVKKNACRPVKPVPVKGFLNSQIVFWAPYVCVCNNASSLGLNRTTIVACCGAQTAELLLVTAVLHLPQSDIHTALEHHFMSTAQQTVNWC